MYSLLVLSLVVQSLASGNSTADSVLFKIFGIHRQMHFLDALKAGDELNRDRQKGLRD